MSYTFKPAVRQDTPLIIGLAGPTKSGKTYSAMRLAKGLCANGKPIVMLNAEGARGHQYAEKFTYLACELTPPYRPLSYTEALSEAVKLKPGVVIIDSVSHCHDGPGGVLEWHEEIMDQRAGKNASWKDRQKYTFSAWIEPKASENELRYQLLSMPCPLILCMRAKEKVKVLEGGGVKDLGWQPICGESLAFETIFTLMLTPGCKGVPDMSLSDMREPFESFIQPGKPIDEALGSRLKLWATGAPSKEGVGEPSADTTAEPLEVSGGAPSTSDMLDELVGEYMQQYRLSQSGKEASGVMNAVVADDRLGRADRDKLIERGKKRIAELTTK